MTVSEPGRPQPNLNVWWCNQSSQWNVERKEGVVCSSDGSQRGGNNQYRKTVGEAKRGDLVVHYRKPRVVAFSRAQANAKFFVQLPLLQGEDYGSGWRFRTEYFELKNPVHRESFAERLMPFRVQHYPIDRDGYVRQGYFFPFSLEGLRVVLSEVAEDLPVWLRKHELLVDPPERANGPSILRQRSYRSTKVDYAVSDAANRVLGSQGEEFVVEYERSQLEKKGRLDLAERVQRISETMGDGAGYDVLSFDERGTVKHIEVKTTNGPKKTPFIVTVNEVEFSKDNINSYYLYRLFDFDKYRRLYILSGSLNGVCSLEPIQFRARFRL
jgi:hypothetical protein